MKKNICPISNISAFILLAFFTLFLVACNNSDKNEPSEKQTSELTEKEDYYLPITFDKEQGKLVYGIDQHKSKVIDFSYAGYNLGKSVIPEVPIIYYIKPSGGKDDGRIIQAAIDKLAALPMQSNGFRGAILLEKGTYNIARQLKINVSGIVLRGCGDKKDGTVLKAVGTDRRTLIEIRGVGNRNIQDDKYELKNDFTPAGVHSILLESTKGLSVGDKIVIHVPCTEEWIEKMGMNNFKISRAYRANWQPNSRDVYLDRTITAINKDEIVLDAPTTVSLDKSFQPVGVYKYEFPGRISHVGVENIRCVSEYDKKLPKDEEHSWIAVSFEYVENAWARNLSAVHFSGSAVTIFPEGKNITVMDCRYLDPIGENGGYRRRSFFTLGQMSLFIRCYSRNGRNDFVTGHCATGPSAFVDCRAENTSGNSGAIESWATGILWDNVSIDGGKLYVRNLEQKDMGVGWTGGNCFLWNCMAGVIECEKSPVACNWALGGHSELSGDGVLHPTNSSRITVSYQSPKSFYNQQLLERFGENALERIKSVEISSNRETARLIDSKSAKATILPSRKNDPLNVNKYGWLLIGERYITKWNGGVAWWKGSLAPGVRRLPAITRFVPGRHGLNFIDNLDELTDSNESYSITSHKNGLWYDRRRDDHLIVRRVDADVVAPFYEHPWARSGIGTAWDGLSKFDLTRYNTWYFNRLKTFAGLCDEKKQVLINYAYCQHHVLESGAHWADYPWRPANNIQGGELDIPEPPPYKPTNKGGEESTGKPRVFAAESFYNLTQPLKRKLHRNYYKHIFNTFANTHNVIQSASSQYTGPLEFIQFWYDVLIDWKKETGKDLISMIQTTKDVQDAILEDPVRGKHVDVISIMYWCYRPDGSLYAFKSTSNKAFRELKRIEEIPEYDPYQTYRLIREYKVKYPEKSIIYKIHKNADPWVLAMAGASATTIKAPQEILNSIGNMQVLDIVAKNKQKVFCLGDNRSNYLFYSQNNTPPELDFTTISGDFEVREINIKTGEYTKIKIINGGANIKLPVTNNSNEPVLYWLCKIKDN